MFNKFYAVIFLGFSLLLPSQELPAQLIIEDHNGSNLFVYGTPGDDIIFVLESTTGDLLVWVNGQLTNVTAKSGVDAKGLYSIGTILLGGNDFISYQFLPELRGGTVTNGGVGSDEVVEGKGVHVGSNVDKWSSLTTPSDSVDEALPPSQPLSESVPFLGPPSPGPSGYQYPNN